MDTGSPGSGFPAPLPDDLSELENYINDIWDFLPIPVAYITPIGALHDMNRCFEDLAGRKKAELVGKEIGDICPALHADHFQAIVSANCRVRALESVCIRPDRRATPVNVYVYARRDEANQVIGCFCAFIDIAEKKEKEAQLVKSELEYRTALDAMFDAVHVIDRDYRIVVMNETFRRWNRDLKLPADAVGCSLFDVFAFLTDKVRAEYDHVFETGKMLLTEESTRVGDRTFCTFTRKTPIIEAGQVTKIITEIRDVTESRQMQNAIKNSEERFRIAASSASDLVWDWDIDGDRIEWFGGIDGLLEYGAGECCRTKEAWDEIIHPADRERVQAALDRHLTGREPYDVEYRVVRKDGRVRHWISRGSAIRDQEGKPVRMIGAVTDISERKVAEQRILSANERLKFLMASVTTVIYTSAAADDYLTKFISENVTGILGYTPGEIIEKKDFWIEHVHPGDRSRLKSERQYLFDIGLYTYEYRFLHKKGNYIWVRDEMRLVRGRDGEPVEIVGMVMDVTERKTIEEALIRSEKKYRQFVELTHEGVWVIDENNLTTYVNPRLAKMLGYEMPEMIGRSFFSFMDENMVVSAQRLVDRRRQGIVEQHDFEFVGKHGQRLIFLMETAPIFSDDGTYVGAVAMVTDITARADAERQLRRHLDFEKIVTEISTKFINTRPELTDEMVSDALSTIGTFLQADRSYVFKISSDGTELTNTHEWCAPGIEPQMQRIQRAPADSFRWSVAKVKQGEAIVVNRLAELPPDAAAEKREFETQKIKSLIMVPMSFRGKTLGFTGLDMVGEERTWHEITIVILRMVGEIFARAFEDQKTEFQMQETCQKLKIMLDGTVNSLAAAAEKKDPYTAGHQRRVTQLAVAIAAELGFDQEQKEGIRVAGTLHDIGKIYVPAEILSKPTKLTVVEYDIVKIHPQVAFDILENIDFPWPVARIVVQHHERLDGSGYPGGLKAGAITVESRILTVADVVEAMSSHRPYRPAKGIDEALETIKAGRGTIYDADAVDACTRLFKEKNFQFT